MQIHQIQTMKIPTIVFKRIATYVRLLTGGAYASARALTSKECDIVIHWDGGRHHAKSDEASGFCYINDCVLSILHLSSLPDFSRILYIDLDIHHPNGVQDAFYFTSKVFTLSFHHFAQGFYPTTGSEMEIGRNGGKGYCCNVTLEKGMKDRFFVELVTNVVREVMGSYRPTALVVQCGTDGLAGDPLVKTWSLSSHSYTSIIQHILSYKVPTLLLGGGGYNSPNAARVWTALTAACLNKELDQEIPEHEYWEYYKPEFRLEAGNVDSRQQLDPDEVNKMGHILERVQRQLLNIKVSD